MILRGNRPRVWNYQTESHRGVCNRHRAFVRGKELKVTWVRSTGVAKGILLSHVGGVADGWNDDPSYCQVMTEEGVAVTVGEGVELAVG